MEKCRTCSTEKHLVKDSFAKKGFRLACKTCNRKRNQKWREANRDLKNAQGKRWRDDNAETQRQLVKKWKLSNSDRHKVNSKKWQQNNAGKINAYTRKRQASKLQRTPSWLTEEHLKTIESFYVKARDLQLATGKIFHVDHIVPLQGKNVSGLHVPWNLQILSASDNSAKGNR